MNEKEKITKIENFMIENELSSCVFYVDGGMYMLSDVGGTIITEFYEEDELV